MAAPVKPTKTYGQKLRKSDAGKRYDNHRVVVVMSKSFDEAFEAWKKDKSYQIGDDIGWEFADTHEVRPTRTDSSLTPEKDGDSDSA